MSEELKQYCDKFGFGEDTRRVLEDLESVFNQIKEVDEDFYQKAFCQCMSEYISISIETFCDLSERDMFLVGMGSLGSEMNEWLERNDCYEE